LSPVYKRNVRKKFNKTKRVNDNNGGTKAKWIYKVFMIAFGLSVFFGLISQNIMVRVNIIVSIIILLIIIFIGIIFDIIGVAVATANETPFHAMAADKVPGGKEAVKLIRNADIVTNICNDVVGDICGIISGAAGATIILKAVLESGSISETMFNVVMSGLISTLTIGGKAMGKAFAINNSKKVVYDVALFIYTLKNRFKIDVIPGNGANKKNGSRK
jgi:CBS domain containing-hemolysin-like protein